MRKGAGNARYAQDKPISCDYCYFQPPGAGICELDACFYLLPENEAEPEKGAGGCKGCPYGRDRPCIGFCTAELLSWMRMKKDRKGGGGGAG